MKSCDGACTLYELSNKNEAMSPTRKYTLTIEQ